MFQNREKVNLSYVRLEVPFALLRRFALHLRDQKMDQEKYLVGVCKTVSSSHIEMQQTA